MHPLRLIGIIALALLVPASGSAAATLQPIGDFDQPIYVTSDPGNPNRLFGAERTGKIQQVLGGSTTLFADLSSITQCGATCNGERGLYSIALAPDFDSSGRLYFDYTNSVDGSIHIAEVRQVGTTAALSTVRDVLTIAQPPEANHGGQLQFGPEGDLFVSTGDDEATSEGQHLNSLLARFSASTRSPAARCRTRSLPAIHSPPTPHPPARSGATVCAIRFACRPGGEPRRGGRLRTSPTLGRGADYGWNCKEGLDPYRRPRR